MKGKKVPSLFEKVPDIFSPRKFKLQWVILLVFLSLMVFFIIGSPRSFLGYRIYVAFMSTIPFAGIMALGLVFIIILGEIDLSFPSVMAVSGFTFAAIFTSTGSAWLALASSLIIGSVAGVLNGVLVTKIGAPSIVATVGTMFLWRGFVHIASGGSPLVLSPERGTILSEILTGRVGGAIPAQFLWMLLIVVVLWFILNRHRFGNNVCFVGDNESSARRMGINVDRTKIFVFILMGLLASIAGMMNDFEMRQWWPSQGAGHLLPVFAMVFVGGTSVKGGKGTIFGTFIGILMIGVLEAGIVAVGLSGFWTEFIYGLIIVISVSMQMKLGRLGR